VTYALQIRNIIARASKTMGTPQLANYGGKEACCSCRANDTCTVKADVNCSSGIPGARTSSPAPLRVALTGCTLCNYRGHFLSPLVHLALIAILPLPGHAHHRRISRSAAARCGTESRSRRSLRTRSAATANLLHTLSGRLTSCDVRSQRRMLQHGCQ